MYGIKWRKYRAPDLPESCRRRQQRAIDGIKITIQKIQSKSTRGIIAISSSTLVSANKHPSINPRIDTTIDTINKPSCVIQNS